MGVNVEFFGGPLDGRAQHVKSAWELAVERHLRVTGAFPPDALADHPVEEIRISGSEEGWSYQRTDRSTEEGNVIFRWRKHANH